MSAQFECKFEDPLIYDRLQYQIYSAVHIELIVRLFPSLVHV